MTPRITRRLASLCLLPALALSIPAIALDDAPKAPVATPPAATPAAADTALPTGEAVLDRYVEVTGGRDAYEKLKNRHFEATMEIEAMNIKGTLKSWQVNPSSMYTEIELPGFGQMTSGVNNDIAWDNNPMTGPRLLEGVEKLLAKRGAQMNPDLTWKEYIKSVECVALEDYDGKPAYKLISTPHEGKPITTWYDKETGLLLVTIMTFESQMGEIPMELVSEDYREVDGIKIPHKLTQKVMGNEVVIMTQKIEHNINIPADRFNLPEDIQALVDAQKETPAKESGATEAAPTAPATP